MDRRNFLSASLTASAVSLAGTVTAGAQSGASRPNAAAEYYDLQRYQLVSGPGIKLTNNFFAGALIPALNRLGVGPVGAFSIYFGPDTPAYYLLLPSSKLETLVTADLKLAKDPVFMKAAAPFWDAPASAPPYITSRPPRRRRKSASIICANTCPRQTWTTYAKWKCSIMASSASSRKPAPPAFFTPMR